MPVPIPYYDLIFHTLRYLVRRQMDRRPTTLYQLGSRLGYGTEQVLGLLEINRVDYILIPHGDVTNRKTTELLLKHIPESIVVQLGIKNEEIEKALNIALAEIEPVEQPDSTISREEMRDLVDPNAKYRIHDRAYGILKKELITQVQLSRELKRRGYPEYFVADELMRNRSYEQLSPLWRPFYYGYEIYFLKKCLKSLQELVQFFPHVNRSIAELKKKKYRKQKVKPQNPNLFRGKLHGRFG